MPRTEQRPDLAVPVANRAVIDIDTVVVDDAGLVLLVRGWGGRGPVHRLPGGPQLAGESAAEAARRSVLADTGVDVEIVGVVGVYSDPSTARCGVDGWSQDFAVCFRGRPVGGALRAGRSGEEAVWVEPEELDALEVSSSSRSRLEHGLTDRELPWFS